MVSISNKETAHLLASLLSLKLKSVHLGRVKKPLIGSKSIYATGKCIILHTTVLFKAQLAFWENVSILLSISVWCFAYSPEATPCLFFKRNCILKTPLTHKKCYILKLQQRMLLASSMFSGKFITKKLASYKKVAPVCDNILYIDNVDNNMK